MTSFLFAWELGGNYGHLARDLPVAEYLRAAGHGVTFAVADAATAVEVLGRRRFAFVQSPLPRRVARLARPPANYAELLLAEGWGDQLSLLGLVRAWQHLFALARPDVLVADHAPTALLSARAAGVPAIALGSGFEIPPDASPLPSIRPWEEMPAARLADSEDSLLDGANAVGAALGAKPLKRLADLFSSQSILTTFPELDHYGPRQGAAYVGSIHGATTAAAAASWGEGDRPRILAYLRPGQGDTATALATLADLRVQAVCAVPRASPPFVAKFSRGPVAIYPQPIDFGPLLASADAWLGYGGAGTIAEALLAGVPLLAIPQTVEQYLAARRAEIFGAGIVLGPGQRTADDIRENLGKLLADPSYRQAARNFAERYGAVTPAQAASCAAEAILGFSVK